MRPGFSVLLPNRGEGFLSKLLGDSNQSGPETPMDEGDLPFDQSEAQNVWRIIDSSEGPEDLRTLFMSPPTPQDRLASNYLGEIRHGPIR